MSFAAYVIFPSGGKATNTLRFATRDEANSYGFDLLCRWTQRFQFLRGAAVDMANDTDPKTAPEDYEIREMEDAVNYTWGKAGAERIEEGKA